MKRFISSALCAAMILVFTAGSALAAEPVRTETMKKGLLGTLNSSGASYEARMTIPGYIGQLETELVIDGEKKDVSVSVIKPKEEGNIDIRLKRFDGHIYSADLETDEYIYTPGKGFEASETKTGSGKSSQEGGNLNLGTKPGLYGGRVYFYYSMKDMKYKNIDEIPQEKWKDMFWFNLGSTYVLQLSNDAVNQFLTTGELMGYTWPGLRMILSGEEDMNLFVNGDFANFKPSAEYKTGVYTDINGQWHEKYVGSAYEYGLMKGNEDGTFSPDGNMTVGEAIALTSRMHNIYFGMKGDFIQGSPWYQVYVDYAIDRGMIDKDTFDDYERNITRKEMVSLMSEALDFTELEKINKTVSIPDVKHDDKDFAAIKALYESGVLTGSEADGSFLPDDDIMRSEVSAIAVRLICPHMRVAFENTEIAR